MGMYALTYYFIITEGIKHKGRSKATSNLVLVTARATHISDNLEFHPD